MKPLSKRQRSLSLIILLVLFVLSAPVILLYSLGYRLSTDLTFQKTGGVFIHSNILNSAVFIDGEYYRENGIFIRNTLIQDLTPDKEYKIEVHKDGYQSWVKTLRVYPSIVTEGRVLMMPNEFDRREILPYLDANKVATSTSAIKKAKPNNPEYIEFAALFASTTATSTSVATTTATSTGVAQKSKVDLFFDRLGISDFEKLKGIFVNANEVSWLENGNIKLFWIDDLSSIPYYYCGGEEERVCESQITLDWNDEILRFAYLPQRDDVWIVLTKGGIYAVEVDGRSQRNIQYIESGQNLDFRLSKNNTLVVKEAGKLFEINL